MSAKARARAVVDEYRRRLGMSDPLDWNDPTAINHGVTVVVDCITDALQRERADALTRALTWVVQDVERYHRVSPQAYEAGREALAVVAPASAERREDAPEGPAAPGPGRPHER